MVLWLLFCVCVFAEKSWDDWNDLDDLEINAVAERRRSINSVQCGNPEGFIPCLTYGTSPAGKANVAGCLDIQMANCEWQGRSITCNNGYYAVAPATPTVLLCPSCGFAGCKDINECAVYGYSANQANTVSCTEGINQRTITCAAGFYPKGRAMSETSVTLIGNAAFSGCIRIPYCTTVGYSGLADNTVSCIDGAGTRTITCNTVYYAVAPSTASITLTGPAPFLGCKVIETCKVYGFSGLPATGTAAVNGAGCIQTIPNKRTITCLPGYGIVGTSTKPPTGSVVLVGNEAFVGCYLVNYCTLYGDNGLSANVQNCTTGVHQRTIYCNEGFYPIGGSDNADSITLVGPTTFGGCVEANICTSRGYGDRPDYTLSCVPSTNTRTITCQPGYHAVGTTPADNTVVVLKGAAPFLGCELIDTCTQYGYSGNRADTVSCVSGRNQRTITCDLGFFAVAPNTRFITLTGNQTFLGCRLIDNCAVYGNSNKNSNYAGCVNGENSRTVSCMPGYYPLGGPMNMTSIVLTGSVPFQGCIEVDECVLYGYSTRNNYTKSCTDLVNGRRITCNDGYAAVAPNITSVTLSGNALFDGCKPIRTCTVYGTSGKPQFVESCVQRSINNRTITCLDGYAVKGFGELPMIVLTGPTTFSGCVQVDMCSVYGFSNRSANTERCVNGINNRTITCKRGYHIKSYEHDHVDTPIPPPYKQSILITGYDPFLGCKEYCGDGIITPGEQCDDGNQNAGDGCENCKIMDGFICGAEGFECCFAGDFYKVLAAFMKLECVDGFWMRALDTKREYTGRSRESLTIEFNQESTTLDQSYFKLCGPVVVSGELEISGGQLIVYGPLTVVKEGYLLLHTTTTNNESRVVMEGPCKAWKPRTTWAPEDQGLLVEEGGWLGVTQDSELPLHEDEDVSDSGIAPLVHMNGCSRIDGGFRYNAESIPQENNYFPLTYSYAWRNCTFSADVKEVESTLPSCPIVLLQEEAPFIVMVTATRRMCAGAVAGLVVGGTAAAVAAAAAVGLLLMPSAPQTLDYVTL